MNAPLPREHVSLQDKFAVQEGWIYLTGTQALTRLPLQQRLRDQAAGLNTGGFISGYRGSPLGRYDMELWAQKELLEAHNIHFQPGINEDLAATSVWGSQYVGLLPGATVDGVFGIWYGKGPGTDRSGDALRHLGCAGSGKHGGVLAIAGDDHGAKSSTVSNFSDPVFIAAGMPVLYPGNTQELLDLGLHGIAMSRYSGCAVGFKVHNDVVEGGGSVRVAPDAPAIVLPQADVPAHCGPQGLNIRVLDFPLIGEERLVNHKLPAALAYARANRLNFVLQDVPAARLGLLAAGKSYQDLLQALAGMGLDDARQRELGLRVGKIGLVWPLDPAFVRDFAQGLERIIVVEEKRGILEDQLKGILYDLALAHQPRVVGKYDGAQAFAPERGTVVFQGWGELSPTHVMHVLAAQMRALDMQLPGLVLLPLASKLPGLPDPATPNRPPGFCSGCPHNRSTRVPDGSRAMVGIGCHGMAVLVDPMKTPPMFTQMGAEGMHWLGQHRFTREHHVFVNIGDGTYCHSGFLAIRAALASGANMTYKVLVNGFVSMTGGQPIDGELSVRQIVTELLAEGVQHLFVLSDEPGKHPSGSLPAGVPVLHRAELDAVMRQCRELPGVSVIVYDQPCATERRRLRKRGKWPDADQRSFINAAVCDGCGDCSKASNCLSIEPLETAFGRKRRINQGSCNKDFSCVEGFCPSFVTVRGGRLRKSSSAGRGTAAGAEFPPLPEPALPHPTRAFSVLITGVGGTGVVTAGQVLGMAAHLDGLAAQVLDVTGLAQKYGAVMSHLRIARHAGQLHANRIAAGEADTVIGCDLVVTAGDEALARLRPGRSQVIVASDLVPTSEFARNPDWRIDPAALVQRIRDRCGEEHLLALEGLRLATQLTGEPIAANMFMLGAAWQSGALPLSHAAIQRAIELNGVQVELSQAAFLWGRRAAVDLAAVERAARIHTRTSGGVQSVPPTDTSLAGIIQRSEALLTEYQDAAYAHRYRALVDRAMAAERAQGLGDRFALAVARSYCKLLAIKDEFEVARLFTSEAFRKELDATFEGDWRISFNVGAWPFGGADSSGKPVKQEVGPCLMGAFGVLARLKGLRGSWLDPFRSSAERQLAVRLLADYEREVDDLIENLSAASHDTAVQLAALPEKIRGFGHVRAAHARAVEQERAQIQGALRAAVEVAHPALPSAGRASAGVTAAGTRSP